MCRGDVSAARAGGARQGVGPAGLRSGLVWVEDHVLGHGALSFLGFVLESYLRHRQGKIVPYRQALVPREAQSDATAGQWPALSVSHT